MTVEEPVRGDEPETPELTQLKALAKSAFGQGVIRLAQDSLVSKYRAAEFFTCKLVKLAVFLQHLSKQGWELRKDDYNVVLIYKDRKATKLVALLTAEGLQGEPYTSDYMAMGDFDRFAFRLPGRGPFDEF